MTLDSHDEIVVARNLSQPKAGQPGHAEQPPQTPRSRLILRALLIVVPAAVAMVTVTVLVGNRARVDCDLQLQTVSQARPGTTLPVRALFYTGLQSIEGARLQATEANVQLIDSAQQVLVSLPMQPGLGDTLEASLPLAPHLRGPLTVRVTTRDQESPVTVDQSCVVSDAAPALDAQPRALRPLQQLSAGSLRREGGAIPPSSLDLRIVGGACAPELPCEVLVHVGEPSAVISVDTYAALDLVTAPPSAPSADVVPLSVRVHGPEAELRLAASIDGQVVARRAFRLAIAQAMLPLAVDKSVVVAGQPLAFTRASGDAACVVDLFHDERWVQSKTFEHCDDATFKRADIVTSAGLWRLQTRDDPFGGDASATRLLYVPNAKDSQAKTLSALATRVLETDRSDLMAHRVIERAESFAARDFAGYSAWLLATLEDRVVTLPKNASSYPAALNELEAKRSRLRSFSLIALLLSAIAAVTLIARRGLSASSRARDIMGDAGDPEAHSQARRARMTFTVIASATLIAVAFVAVALYVIARG